ncbi:ATP synthase subunit I [Anaerosporobacter faecicola]|uniref:ATP synthase subunit I n=1 Tax=Anaerosporobacter faecicola TaxID=2718714 RepID=UPI0014395ACF|nr:ATP synthase subunit I [Anaerosporobacter faecicola]
MNDTLKDLLFGIVISAVIVSIIGMMLTDNKVTYLLGVLLGTVIAIMLVIHLNATISKALDMTAEGATRYTKKMAILRIIIMGCAVVIALTFSEVFSLVGTILGILGLKFSAYLQPLTNKFITKKIF